MIGIQGGKKMIQLKYNQNNEERFEIIRFLPFVTAEQSKSYFEKWLNGEDWRESFK